MSRRARLAGFFAPVLLLGGCAAGPDYRPPAPPDAKSFLPAEPATTRTQTAPAPPETPGPKFLLDAPPARWWTLFGAPEIGELVQAAVANNPDVAAAEAALVQSRELLYAQRGAFLPSVAAQFQGSRQRNSATLAPPLSSNATIYSLYTPQLTVSYAPDLFGGVRRQVEAGAAREQAQEAQRDAAYLTLTSNVVQAAVQIASLQEQVEIQTADIEEARRLLALVQRQAALGQVSGADVATQETALAQARQALQPLARQLAQERDLLTMLLGRRPEQTNLPALRLSSLLAPLDLPLGMPSELVARRPDIRAAEANLHAASAQVGIAAAARLPSLTLTANYGASAGRLSELSDPANRMWGLAADLVQPVFQGGALRHQQRAAEAGYRQAQAQYRSIVLQAFQNVADSLQALQQDAQGLAAARASEAAATRALRIAERQLAVGEVSASTLLGAEQAFQQARLSLVQARTAQLTDTIALFQALGAGEPWRGGAVR